MKKIKSIGVIIVAICSLVSHISCSGTKNVENQKEKVANQKIEFSETYPFTIQNVFFQRWVAGVESAGQGITFQFKVQDLKEGVAIKEVYFRNMVAIAQESPVIKKTYLASFSIQESKDFIMDENPIKEAQNTPKKHFPFQLKENDAVVKVDNRGKILYIKLQDITEKPMLALPSTNPDMDGGLKN